MTTWNSEDFFGSSEDSAPSVTTKLPAVRKATPEEDELYRKRDPWERFKDAYTASALHNPIGAEGGVRYLGIGRPKGITDTQLNQMERILSEKYARKAEADPALKGSAQLGAVNSVADFMGSLLGGVDPTYAIAPGRTAAQRIAAQAGVNAGQDAVAQGIEIHRGVRDEYDPKETLLNLAVGAAVQGGGEGIRSVKLGRAVQRGSSHPDWAAVNSVIVNDLEGGGTLSHPNVSKKGAMGPQQVMPETARDPGFGIRPWNGKTQSDLARVGRQYSAAMMDRYDGDTAKVFAAYNAGPSRVDAAIAKHGAPWLDYMPSETKKYVRHGLKSIGQVGPENLGESSLVRGEQPSLHDQADINQRLSPSDELAADLPALPDNVVDFENVRQNVSNQKTRGLLDEKLDSALAHEDAVLHDESPMTYEEATHNLATAEKMHQMLPDDHPYKDKTKQLVDVWRNVQQTVHERELDNIRQNGWNENVEKQRVDPTVDVIPMDSSHEKFTRNPVENVPANDRIDADPNKTLHEYTDAEWKQLSKPQQDKLVKEANARLFAPKEGWFSDGQTWKSTEKQAFHEYAEAHGMTPEKARDIYHMGAERKDLWADASHESVAAFKQMNARANEIHSGNPVERDPNPPASSSSFGTKRPEGINPRSSAPPKGGIRSWRDIKEHPAVETVDDYRPDGMFINLKPGYEWSEQRSFGVETLAEARRMLNSVTEVAKDLYKNEEGAIKGDAGDEDLRAVRSERKLVLDRLGDLLDQAAPIRREAEAAISHERSRRLAAAFKAQKKAGGREGLYQALGAMKGEMGRPRIQSIADQFTPKEINGLIDTVWNSPKLEGYEHIRAAKALDKLLGAQYGEIPTASEVALLAKAMPEKASVWRRLIENEEGTVKLPEEGTIKAAVVNTLGLTRTLKASFDVSAPGRQGMFLIGSKAYWKALPGMFKSFVSEGKFHELQDEIRNRPTHDLMNKAGLEVTRNDGSIIDREEAFVSQFAEKIPGVRHSERAYLAFLNKLRADMFDDFVRRGDQLGIDFVHDPHYLKSAARFINAATGRGSVKWMGRNGELLSKALFSPKLMASRVQLLNPGFYAGLHPTVRAQAAKHGLIYASTVMSMLGLATAAGAQVEWDPRSSDFAKIKVGNTRFDVTGGFQPYVRFYAQFLLGQQKGINDSVVRNVGWTPKFIRDRLPGADQPAFKPTTRKDVVYRFVENKESPNASEITRLLQGSDAVGNPLTVQSEATNLFAPLIIQDTYQAYQDLGAKGLLTAIPNAVGVGIQTYTPKAKKASADSGFKASDFGGATWSSKDFQ